MNTSRTASPLFAAFSALALLGTVALTGCAASDLAGPESTPQQMEAPAPPSPAQTSSDNEDGGGTDTKHPLNTMPSDD
jgi:hypothetical protein